MSSAAQISSSSCGATLPPSVRSALKRSRAASLSIATPPTRHRPNRSQTGTYHPTRIGTHSFGRPTQRRGAAIMRRAETGTDRWRGGEPGQVRRGVLEPSGQHGLDSTFAGPLGLQDHIHASITESVPEPHTANNDTAPFTSARRSSRQQRLITAGQAYPPHPRRKLRRPQVTQPIEFFTSVLRCNATRVRMKVEVTLQSNAYKSYLTVSMPQHKSRDPQLPL